MKTILFSLILSVVSIAANANVLDSLGVEKKGKSYFIKHKVEPKESLYALSKRYGVTVSEIKEANAGKNLSGLSVGQLIYVPAKNYSEGAASEATATPAPASNSTTAATPTVHKVKSGETLYAIAKKYNVGLAELKSANPQAASGLKIGMDVIIPAKEVAQTSAPVKEVKKENTPAAAKAEELKPAKVEANSVNTETVKPIEKKPEPVNVVEKPAPVKEVAKTEIVTAAPKAESPKPSKTEEAPKAKPAQELPTGNSKVEKTMESGLAEQAPVKAGAPDFYAFHKTAPIGTILRIVNVENGQSAYARVVGILTSNSDSVVQLSSKTLARLNAKEDKVKVSISYF